MCRFSQSPFLASRNFPPPPSPPPLSPRNFKVFRPRLPSRLVTSILASHYRDWSYFRKPFGSLLLPALGSLALNYRTCSHCELAFRVRFEFHVVISAGHASYSDNFRRLRSQRSVPLLSLSRIPTRSLPIPVCACFSAIKRAQGVSLVTGLLVEGGKKLQLQRAAL